VAVADAVGRAAVVIGGGNPGVEGVCRRKLLTKRSIRIPLE
jgi:hypothetical protein